MRLEQLHYLIELYRTRSFSKAAENVFITQPSLSTAISSLEEELQVKLFERMRTGVYPTAMGEEIVQFARELIAYEQRIYETAKNAQPEERLRVLAIPAVSFGILLMVMSSFQKNHPNINFVLNEIAPKNILNESIRPLNNDPGTFAICALMPEGHHAIIEQLQYDHIESEQLYRDTFVCHMAKNHPLADKETLTMKDFLAYPGIDLSSPSGNPGNTIYTRLYSMSINEDYRRSRQNTHIQVDNLTSLKRLVISGNGISMMPKMIVQQDQDYLKGDIIMRPFSDVEIYVDYYLLKSNLYPLKPIEEAFLKNIREYFSSLQNF